jgi:hypothetical protein
VIGTIEQPETKAMMEFKTGNILAANAEALVNTVNCVGIMGRGIALQFKEKFPANFKAYAAACERGEVQPGHMFVFPTDWVTGTLSISPPSGIGAARVGLKTLKLGWQLCETKFNSTASARLRFLRSARVLAAWIGSKCAFALNRH